MNYTPFVGFCPTLGVHIIVTGVSFFIRSPLSAGRAILRLPVRKAQHHGEIRGRFSQLNFAVSVRKDKGKRWIGQP